MKMSFGYCNICKRPLSGYDDYVVKGGKKICNDCLNTGKEKTADYNNLKEYLKALFHKETIPLSWENYIDKLVKMGRTYSGIQGSLYYFYEIKGNIPTTDGSALGIVDYVYDEAKDYFAEIAKRDEYNSNFKEGAKKRVWKMSVPQKKKTSFDIGDL